MKKAYIILLSVLLASCGMVDKEKEVSNNQVGISTGEISLDSYVPGGMGANLPDSSERMSAKKEKELLNLVPEEEIAFTDPDNPLADIKDIDDAFQKKKKNSQLWGQSYDLALREARRSGKGILIWFHDNQMSPPSKLLNSELLSTSDFLDWAKNHLVFLCYDKHAKYKAEHILNEQGLPISQDTIKIRKSDYVNSMFERFNIRGAPAIVMVSPDGSTVDSWFGYKSGTKKSVFEKIKHTCDISRKKYEKFKTRLEQQGYRKWRGRNGSSIFAKFTRYDEKNSNVWLREFDGFQSKTKLASLISKDQQWVLDEIQEKKKKTDPSDGLAS